MDVARDMRYAGNQEGEKLFTVSEFLTEQKIHTFQDKRLNSGILIQMIQNLIKTKIL